MGEILEFESKENFSIGYLFSVGVAFDFAFKVSSLMSMATFLSCASSFQH